MSNNWNVAYLSVKYAKALLKKEARETTLSSCSKTSLCRYLKSLDSHDHYSDAMLKAKNKYQLIQSIVEEEGITYTIDEYAEQLESLEVDTKKLGEVFSFGV